MPKEETVTFEDCKIVFRNFAGAEKMYNPQGKRNFCVLLDDDTAKNLGDYGWNVKYLKPREEGDEPQAYLKVNVSFKGRPPTIVMIGARGRTNLDEETCMLLDWVFVKTVDLIVRPYDWEVNSKLGRSAYLRSIYVTIDEDDLAIKYADIPDAPARDDR